MPEYSPIFEEFWSKYPPRGGRKVGKKTAYERFKKLDEEDIPRLMEATNNYRISERVKQGFARDAIRFLQADYWKDWLEPERQHWGKPFGSYFDENLE